MVLFFSKCFFMQGLRVTKKTASLFEALLFFFLLGLDEEKASQCFFILRGFLLFGDFKTTAIITTSEIEVDTRSRVSDCWSPYTNRDILSWIPDMDSVSRVSDSWSVDANRDITSRVPDPEASSRISKATLSNTETWRRKAKTWEREVYEEDDQQGFSESCSHCD